MNTGFFGRHAIERMLICSIALLISGCQPKSSVVPTRPVLVLVAASLTDVMDEVVAEYQKLHPQQKVVLSFGPSNALAQQVLAGAEADLFLSASREWADQLQQAGKVTATQDLLGNRLVLVVPKGNPAQVAEMRGLGSDLVRHVAIAGEKVPAGQYAQQTLANLGLKSTLENAGKIVRGSDVRVTLAFVSSGEADAGIVYRTDARLSEDVEMVEVIDAALHDPILYPCVRLSDTEESRLFYEFVTSDRASPVFQKFGFELPRDPAAVNADRESGRQ